MGGAVIALGILDHDGNVTPHHHQLAIRVCGHIAVADFDKAFMV